MSMEPVSDLATVKLHDMSLTRITLEWKAGWCTFEIDGPVVPGASGARLRWTGVTALEIPRKFPWGPSISILEARGPIDSRYEIIVQSGDTIAVRASGCEIDVIRVAV
ncbi:MAG: hypothetical protein QOF66_7701 [Mycobacterium sp.]|jgi:hypothetical protein|nr:hypothetical protein [Mycobacterium sp.]